MPPSDLGVAKFDVGELMNSAVLTVQLTGLARYRVRYFFAVRLLRIVAWLLGTGIEIELL